MIGDEAVARRYTDGELVLIPRAELIHLEALLSLPAKLGLDQPLGQTLVANFCGTSNVPVTPGEVDEETLADRLKSGSPFMQIHLTAPSQTDAQSDAETLPIQTLGRKKTASGVDLARYVFRLLDQGARGAPTPSIRVPQFGPVAVVLSALWGRTGSTAIFQSQVRHLVRRGFVVARLYVDHRPTPFPWDRMRQHDWVHEDQDGGRGHFSVLLDRNTNRSQLRKLSRTPEFRRASPIRRAELLISEVVTAQTSEMSWLHRMAKVAVVNHLPHMRLAKKIVDGPLILELHDIYAELVKAHGIPSYVRKGRDSEQLRIKEERETWKLADACVTLSSLDYQQVRPHVGNCWLIPPYRAATSATRRSWPEFCEANRISPNLSAFGVFDLLLWGSGHENNVRSIVWFVDEVLPILSRSVSPRVVIVGRVCHHLPRRIMKHQGILIAGFVDVLQDIALRARVVVVPDQGGSGRSMKLIDALAWGYCFAATSSACRGVMMEGVAFEPATTAEKLASDILSLLKSPESREERRACARALYAANGSREAYSKMWDKVLQSVGLDLGASSCAPASLPKSEIR